VRFRFVLIVATCACVTSPHILSQTPTCAKGYQPYSTRCITQRMADYISCVEASGGNRTQITYEVDNANAAKTDVGAKGSGSGALVKGSGSLKIDRATEEAIASKFQMMWADKGMEECRKVLDSQKPRHNAPAQPAHSSTETNKPSRDSSLNIGDNAKVEVQNNGSNSPTTFGGNNTFNYSAPAAVPCGLKTIGSCKGNEKRQLVYRITMCIRDLYWGARSANRDERQWIGLNCPEGSPRNCIKPASDEVERKYRFLIGIFSDRYLQSAKLLRDHLTDVAPEKLDSFVNTIYDRPNPYDAVSLDRVAAELEILASLSEGDAHQQHDYLADINEEAEQGVSLAINHSCTAEAYSQWINRLSDIYGRANEILPVDTFGQGQDDSICKSLGKTIENIDRDLFALSFR
jgi:hypothetical protein